MKPARSLAVSLVVFVGVGAFVFTPGAAGSASPARWRSFLHVPAVVDLTGPRADGWLTVAADGGLSLLRLGGQPTPFASGPDGYSARRNALERFLVFRCCRPNGPNTTAPQPKPSPRPKT